MTKKAQQYVLTHMYSTMENVPHLPLILEDIGITCPCVLYPPYTSLLYSKTGVYRGTHYFLVFALNYRPWVLVRTCTHNLCFEQKYENSKKIQLKIIIFFIHEKSLYIAWACFCNEKRVSNEQEPPKSERKSCSQNKNGK